MRKFLIPNLKFLIFISLFFVAPKAHAAILYSQAANQDVYEGQTFVVDWFLDTEGKPINSLDLRLNFSKDVLEVDQANAGNSLINLWIKTPTANNQNGTIELTGGIANGINSGRVAIFHSVFKAIKSGTASITMNPASVILLNDGRGTAEVLKFKDELFSIYPEGQIPGQIYSSTHPDQNTWYRNPNVEIKFTPKADTDYSFSFSSNIEIIPDDEKHDVPLVLSYPDRPDGIYYFKLNSKVGPSTWQEAGVFRVQIDSTPPEGFEPLIASDPGIFDGNSFVSFSTLDKTSGISHYKVKVGLFGRAKQTQSPYQLKKPIVGDLIEVIAYDQAGNYRTETIKWPGIISLFEFKLILILTGLITLIISWFMRKKF